MQKITDTLPIPSVSSIDSNSSSSACRKIALSIIDQQSPTGKRKSSPSSITIELDPPNTSTYSLNASLTEERLTIVFKNVLEIPLKFIGAGRFSNVYECVEIPNQTRLEESLPNKEIVIKILQPQYRQKDDLFALLKGEKKELARTMIEKSILQYNQMERLFQERPPEDRPFVRFYNPENAFERGYSIFEKVTPITDSPVWDSDVLFEDLNDFQKKTYNTLLELILEDRLHQKRRLLYLALSDFEDKQKNQELAEQCRLELDLKWNNLGFRVKNNGEIQLVLLDIANTPIESGIGINEPGLDRNTESLCSGLHPNKSISIALKEKKIALLSSLSNDDRYYEILLKKKRQLKTIEKELLKNQIKLN